MGKPPKLQPRLHPAVRKGPRSDTTSRRKSSSDSEPPLEGLAQFSQRLKERREEKYPDAGSFAKEILNVGRVSLSKWENGRTPPAFKNLVVLGEKLHCSVDYLVGATDVRDRIEQASGKLPIAWQSQVIPLNEQMKTAISVFKRVAACDFDRWDDVLKSDELKNYKLHRSDALSLIEQSIESEWVKVEPPAQNTELENRLQEKFRLRNPRVACMPHRALPEICQLLVAVLAADQFQQLVRGDETIAISGGSMLMLMARCLPRSDHAYPGTTFLTLDVSPNLQNPEIDASFIVTQLRLRYRAKAEVISHTVGRHQRINDREITTETGNNGKGFNPSQLSDDALTVYRKALSAHYAFVGVGNPLRERESSAGKIAPRHDRFRLKGKGVVADILFQMIDNNGNEVPLEENEIIPSIRLDDLRQIAQGEETLVIGIASGIHKTNACLAAIKGGYLSTLWCDESLAKSLLQSTAL